MNLGLECWPLAALAYEIGYLGLDRFEVADWSFAPNLRVKPDEQVRSLEMVSERIPVVPVGPISRPAEPKSRPDGLVRDADIYRPTTPRDDIELRSPNRASVA